jgi:zinc transporter 1/2/3
MDLRFAPVFTIWITGMFSAAFPILAHRSRVIRIPRTIFEFSKYFGSGVIISTAFIHLLVPAISKLTSPCLGAAWKSHHYPITLALLALFTICIIGVLAFNVGTAKLIRLGIHYDPHGYRMGAFVTHGPEAESAPAPISDKSSEPETTGKGNGFDFEAGRTTSHIDGSKQALESDENAMAQLMGVGGLEFGIVLHSVLIGLTLAVNSRFEELFFAIIFCQMFDGLALGSRLAYLPLPHKYRYAPFLGAFLYGVVTPIGIAVGLGIRMMCNPGSMLASLVSGVLDLLCAGILMYTGFVELLAHEFLFSSEMRETSIWKLLYALTCMMLGYGVVAIQGKWA